MSEFKEVTIGDVCSVGDGAHSKVKRTDSGIPYLTSKNIGQGSLKLDKLDFISEESFEKLFSKDSKATRRPQPGDVLFGIIGTFGNAYLYKEQDHFGFSSSIGVLRPDPEKLDSEYLYYVVSSKQFKANHANHNAGSVQGYTNIPTVKGLPIPLPPLEEQKRISKILKSLDDKIQLNRQTNQTLEAIAQAIFKSWFVDFEPTRAKIAAKENGQDPELAAMAAIAGKGVDELNSLSDKQLEKLKSTAALFPDNLVESELGEIPEGWEVSTLDSIAAFTNGSVNVTELSLKNYVSTENMLSGKKGISVAASLPTTKTVPYFSKGHILVSNIRPYFKKIWLARFSGGRSNDVLGFKAIDDDSIEFLYNLLYQDGFFKFMMKTSKGAKMPRGDKKSIAGWAIVKPTLAARKAFGKTVSSYYKIIDSKSIESKLLEQIRDALLPKLLSGELTTHANTAELEASA
ncbi:restriction endonuclease subunit S [Eionea flava]